MPHLTCGVLLLPKKLLGGCVSVFDVCKNIAEYHIVVFFFCEREGIFLNIDIVHPRL